MLAINSIAFVWLQSAMQQTAHDSHWTMIYSCIIAFSLLAQAAGVIVAAVFAMKMFHKIKSVADSFEEKASPILSKTSVLMDELSPKIRTITTNVEEVSYTVRQKCDEVGVTVSEINQTVSDANQKTRAHVAHVHLMVDEALATTEEVSKTVQDNIKKPIRQIAGIIAGVRVGIETLVERSPFGKGKGFENPYDL